MRFTPYAAASALAALASAQTFTDCNPMEKACPNDPALPQTWETDFTAGKDAIKGWKQTAGSLTYSPEGAEFSVAKKGDAPTIGSEAYLHFGYVEVKMKAAPGQGIISSIVLQSDNLDEVDWEWIGGVDARVQMNYFGKGNTTVYDRMIEAEVPSTQNEFHTYALNWTAEALTWIIDNKPVRTLKYADANGGKNYPQTPCNVRLGNWPGGDSENEGTRQWAGGEVDYAKAPFKMTVASIKVINYSPGTEYHWKDKTGSFESIEVVGAGNKDGAPQNTVVLEASATATGSGAPLESGFAAPTATGAIGSGNGNGSISFNGTSTTCTKDQQATPAPSGSAQTAVSGGASDFNYPAPTGSAETPTSGGSNSDSSDDSDSSNSNNNNNNNDSGAEKPCSCGTAFVTVTGTPPASKAPASTPLASTASASASAPPPALDDDDNSTPSAPSPPPTAAVPTAPYAPTGGLIMETAPAPSVPAAVPAPSAPIASAPSGVLPPGSSSGGGVGNGTAPRPSAPAEFTGAAATLRGAGVGAGAVAALLCGAMLVLV